MKLKSKMVFLIAYIIVLAITAAAVYSAVIIKPVDVSIVNLICWPDKYHGKLIRVEGIFEIMDIHEISNPSYIRSLDNKLNIRANLTVMYCEENGYSNAGLYDVNGEHVMAEGFFDARKDNTIKMTKFKKLEEGGY